MAKCWYALHTYSGQEQKAKRHLESMITNEGLEDFFGEIVIPTEEVTEMKQGKRSTTTKKFLPSYMLLQVELDKRIEQMVVNTPGITNFVGSGGKPTPLTDDEARRMLGRMESKREVEIDEVPWRAGDQVKVIDGPFADFSGFVSEINLERKKVKVMVSIFGRPTPVELDFLQIESV
ncbi:MAG: transcription termination/antitermination protein NusG [bacterium]